MKPAGYVLAGGIVAGTLDIAYACIFWGLKAGVPVQRIFQSVAAGLLGKATFEGGGGTAALGLALHYFIAITIAVVYYLASRRLAPLRERPLLAGAGYGLIVYGVMNLIVLPLSAAGPGSKNPLWISLSIVVHVFFIGIPVALAARRAQQP